MPYRLSTSGKPGRFWTAGVATIVAVIGALAMLATPAHASRGLEVSMFDDNVLRFRDTGAYLDRWQAMGVRRIRTNVVWHRVAPRSTSTRRPRGFRGWVHTSAGYDWSMYDRIINAAHIRGIKVFASVTGPGPIWASAKPRKRNGAYKPSTREYARFVQAFATRYRRQVDRYGIWNEPNQGGWLQPQSSCRKRAGRWRCSLYSPHYYRRLARAAYPRIRKADRSAKILIGLTAPSGRNDRGSTRPIRPLTFWRTVACRDSRYRRIRTGQCRKFKPIRGHGIAHHPYPVKKRPSTRSRSKSDASLGDTRRLLRVIDKLQRRKGLRKSGRGRFSVWYTEYGYQTNPPDPFTGVSHSRQSSWMQQSQYMMWRQPRVRGWTQYTYMDEPARNVSGRKRWGGWQAGLLRSNGKQKRYARTFIKPFWTSRSRVRSRGKVRFWGQYKPRGRQVIRLQRSSKGRWRTLRKIRTNSRGYWSHTRRVYSTARYRFTYPGGSTGARTVRVTKRR